MQQPVLVLFLLFAFFTSCIHANPGPVGWASVNADGQEGTTGGEGGDVVTVTNMTQLINAAGQTAPLIIQVEGMITISPKGRYVEVRSDKTIIGIKPGSGISQGGFRVGSNQKNIIFKNMTVADTFVEGDWDGKEQDWDGIQIKGTCHHIWIDHCTFLRQGDGAVDITNGANYITVSNCYFGANNKVSLIGSSDTDPYRDRYKVTMHHNWFNETTQRNPRVRFGMVHIFNNYYYNMGGYGRAMGFANSNGYGIGVGVGAQVYSEHNYFERVVNPTDFYDSNTLPGYIIDIDSHFVNSGFMRTAPDGINWDPADYYEYAPDPAAEVKELVMERAGAEQATTNIQTINKLQQGFNISNHPNPFSEYTTLTFRLNEPGRILVTITDSKGQLIKRKIHFFSDKGTQKVKLNGHGMAAGVYIVRLESFEKLATHKIIVQ